MTIKFIEIVFQQVRKIIVLFTSIQIMNMNYHSEQDVTDMLPNSTFNFLQLKNNALLKERLLRFVGNYYKQTNNLSQNKEYNHIEFFTSRKP